MKKFLFLFLCLASVAHAAVTKDFSTPAKTLETYLAGAKAQDFSITDDCFTIEFIVFQQTNEEYMLHRHPGQLRNTYTSMANKEYTVELYDEKAILRFTEEFKDPQPLYFVKEAGSWKIDAMFMFNNVIIIDGNPNVDWKWKDASIDNESIWINK